MIHPARPLFSLEICFVSKSRDGRMDVRTDDMFKIMISTGRDCGSASWIKKKIGDRNDVSH